MYFEAILVDRKVTYQKWGKMYLSNKHIQFQVWMIINKPEHFGHIRIVFPSEVVIQSFGDLGDTDVASLGQDLCRTNPTRQ